MLSDYLMPAASPRSAALNFLVRVVLRGMIATALADTGAGLSFVSSSFVKKHNFNADNLDEDECFDVRLGNGTTVPVNQILAASDLSLESNSFKQEFYVLDLPSGIDLVIGMDFLTANDAWVHPKSKKIHFFACDPSADKAVEVHTVTEYQTLRRIEQLEKLSSKGIKRCENSDQNDYEFVNDTTYTKLLTLMQQNKLDWKSYTDPQLRGKRRSKIDTATAQQIERERKWLPDSSAQQRRYKRSKEKRMKKLILVLHNDVWQPALMNASQYDRQNFTVKLLRDTRKPVVVSRGMVSTFKHGKLNRSANGEVNSAFPTTKGKCRCCLQYGRHMRLNAKQNYCKTCKPLIASAPRALNEIFKPPDPAQQFSQTANSDGHSDPPQSTQDSLNDRVADETSEKEEGDESCNVFLCKLTTEILEETELDEHPAFEDKADKSSHGKYAALKNQMDDTYFSALMTAAVERNKDTWRLFAIEAGIDEKNVDDYIKQRYPIDINSIDKTVEHWQQFADDLCAQRIEHFTCFDKLERWAPLPHHPKLKLRVKKDAVPAQVHRHRVPIHLRDELRKFHEDLYRRGFIEPIYDAEHLSPVVLIKKPDNADGSSRGFRLVVNMQAINATLESIANRIPDTTEVFQRLKHAKMLSVCDLSNGYWNVGLDPQSKRLTAFGSEQSQWVWKCLPQGMVSSGPYFQSWVERLFRRHNILAGHERFASLDREFDLRNANTKNDDSKSNNAENSTDFSHNESEEYAKLNPAGAKIALWEDDGFLDQYLDDSLISSTEEDETPDHNDPLKMVPGHRQHVLQFLRVCSAENLPLQAKKCHFFCKYIRHLGIVCGQGKLMCDPDKVAAAVHIQRPTTKSKLRKFLGAVGWFRMWIDSFAELQQPLNNLLKGDAPDNKQFQKGQWSDEHEKAFIELKKKLITFPVLTNFDPALPTEIVCDSSEHSIGGALLQRPTETDQDGNVPPPVVIAYHSRALTPAEKKYSAQEREMLSCYSCCKKFRHYLLGAHFEVRILNDHRSLGTVKLSKVAANRVGRWNMLLSEFTMSISYLRGEDNHLSDQLSRAVQLPDEAFTKAGPGIDTDDKFEMPFAMAWPEVYRQVLQQSNLDELKLMHMLTSDNEGHDSAKGSQTSADYCAFVDKAHFEAFSDRTDFDESIDQPDRLYEAHEKAIFGISQVIFQAKATFTESQYLTCPDFGPIYERLQGKKPAERREARKRAVKLQQSDNEDVDCMPLTRAQRKLLEKQPKKKPKSASVKESGSKLDNIALDDGGKQTGKACDDQTSEEEDTAPRTSEGATDASATGHEAASKTKKSTPTKRPSEKMLDAIIHRYHIDGGFLYFNSPNDGMVMCVPQGLAIDSIPLERNPDANTSTDAVDHEKKLSLRQKIMDELHKTPMSGHRGYNATVAAIRRRYYWPRMASDISNWVAGCSKCAMSKINRTKPQGKMIPVQLPAAPGQSFNLDLMVDLPEVQLNGVIYSKILVAVDRFSKRVYLMEVPKHATAPQLAQLFVDKVMLEAGNGICRDVVSDRDTLMTSEFWQALFKRLGTTLSMSASRSQQTNGAAERAIAVVEEFFRTRIDHRQVTWPDLIPHVMFAINQMARSELNGRSSLYMERGVEPALPLDLLRALKAQTTNTQPSMSKAESLATDRIADITEMRAQLMLELHAAQDRQKAYYDAQRREVSALLKPGAKAWLKLDGVEFEAIKLKGTKRRKKLNPLYYGPFPIAEQCGPNSFRLELPQEKIDSGLHPVFHTKNLKAYAPDPSYEGKFFDIPDSEIADQEWEITKIMTHRKRYGRNEFLVHYKGFSELRGEYTEEAELRRNASGLLNEYMKRHNIKTDGYRIDDSEYADSSDSDVDDTPHSSPPRERKRSARTTNRQTTAPKSTGSKRSKRGTKRKPRR